MVRVEFPRLIADFETISLSYLTFARPQNLPPSKTKTVVLATKGVTRFQPGSVGLNQSDIVKGMTVGALKSLAKSLPYPIFLQLFYAWDRVQMRAHAEAARKRAGVALLENIDLLKIKSSDTLFVLGSGPSINQISSSRWQVISRHDTVGFNWWLYHAFVPKFYFFESIDKDVWPEAFDSFLELAKRRAAEYASTVKVAMEIHRAGTQTFEHLPAAFKQNLFAAHKVEAPARTEAELTRALGHLKGRGAFQATGRFSYLVKYAASLTSIMVFGLKLGYKRIVLCGIDLKIANYFFQDRRFYPESWEPPVTVTTGKHDTDVPLTWRLPVSHVVAAFKRELLGPAGVELYIESRESALWPTLPSFPTLESELSGVEEASQPLSKRLG